MLAGSAYGLGVVCLVKKGVLGCAHIRESLYGNTRSLMAGGDGLSLTNLDGVVFYVRGMAKAG